MIRIKHPKAVNFVESEVNRPKVYDTENSTSDDNKLEFVEQNYDKTKSRYMALTLGNIAVTLLVDSGDACRILHSLLATEVSQFFNQAHWFLKSKQPQLLIILNGPIEITRQI